MLTSEQISFWESNGYLKLPNFYPANEKKRIQDWVDEISTYPETKGKWMFYYEQSLTTKNKILCRIENFIDFHEGLSKLLHDEKIIRILTRLFGEAPVLFKEKINFKLPGANGFKAHQDEPAYLMFNQHYHITVMICIDNCTKLNGCLSFANGKHKEGLLPQTAEGDITPEVASALDWHEVEAGAGDILLFDSYAPHQSGPNFSDGSRRALFATYNKASDLQKRNEYYQVKRIYFPPENEREEGKDYSLANPFNLGNPIK